MNHDSMGTMQPSGRHHTRPISGRSSPLRRSRVRCNRLSSSCQPLGRVFSPSSPPSPTETLTRVSDFYLKLSISLNFEDRRVCPAGQLGASRTPCPGHEELYWLEARTARCDERAYTYQQGGKPHRGGRITSGARSPPRDRNRRP